MNFLVMFGVKLFPKMLTTLISLSVNHIIICTNWDENGVGQRAATEIKNQLSSFWDSDNIEIRLPAPWNDLNESLTKAGPNFIIELLREKSI
jgi:predicted acetyltransferase